MDQHSNKQTNKQTNKQSNNQTIKQSNNQTDKQTNRQTDKQANKQTGKQTNRQTNKQTNDQTTNKQANKEAKITTKKHRCHNGPFAFKSRFDEVCRLGECAVGISIHFPNHVLHNDDPGSAGALLAVLFFVWLESFGRFLMFFVWLEKLDKKGWCQRPKI